MKTAEEAPSKEPSWGVAALEEVRAARRAQQDGTADERVRWIDSNKYFYDRIKRLLGFIVPSGHRVLEIRCLTGQLLKSVNPQRGVGVEIGQRLVEIASEKHPEFEFIQSEAEDLELGEQFDYIIFNHVFDTLDIVRAFERARKHCHENTVFVVVNYSQWWQPFWKPPAN